MARLRLMKAGHGDLCVAEWDADTREMVDDAEATFRKHREKGCLAFRVDGPGETTAIDTFDETAPEILLVPPVQGG